MGKCNRLPTSIIISGSDSVDEFVSRVMTRAGRPFAASDLVHRMIENWLHHDDVNQRKRELDCAKMKVSSARAKAKFAIDQLAAGQLSPFEVGAVVEEVVNAAQELWEMEK